MSNYTGSTKLLSNNNSSTFKNHLSFEDGAYGDSTRANNIAGGYEPNASKKILNKKLHIQISDTLKPRNLKQRTFSERIVSKGSKLANNHKIDKNIENQTIHFLEAKPIEIRSTSRSDSRTPTLFYIKQKYKMYLDWLNENATSKNVKSKQSASNIPTATAPSLTPNDLSNPNGSPTSSSECNSPCLVDINQLKWYKYENAVLLSNQAKNGDNELKVPNFNSYFNNNRLNTTLTHESLHSHSKPNTLPQLIKAKTKLNVKSNEHYPNSVHYNQTGSSLAQSYAECQRAKAEKAYTANDDYVYPVAKGVKFDSIPSTTPQIRNQNITPLGAINIANQPLKPILKLPYDANPVFNNRRNSQMSTSSVNSEKHQNSGKLENGAVKKTKLPPISDTIRQKTIANCSDVFYTIINEMEKDQLLI